MRKPLISASEIPAIVKEFLGKNYIKTYEPIENVISRKFFLSYEERQSYDVAKNTEFNWIFSKGKDFEEQTVNLLSESFKDKYEEVEIIDFNNFFPNNEKGKRQKLLVCNDLSICCVPDILVITNKTNYNIIEIKSSDYNTEMVEAYKYQIAMQGLLLAKEYGKNPADFTYRLILQETKEEEIEGEAISKTEAKTLKIAGGSKIWGAFEDVEPYQKEILVALNRLWKAFEKGHLEKYRISFEDIMKPFNKKDGSKVKKEVIELEDPELLNLANDYLEEKENEKSSKYILDTIKKKLSTLTASSVIVKLKSSDGTIFNVSYSVSEPIYWTEEMKQEAIKKARAIEVGTLKTDRIERLSIKI